MSVKREYVADDDKEVVQIECIVIAATALAILIRVSKDDPICPGKEGWVPRNQIHDDSEIYQGEIDEEGLIVMTHWIANLRGFVK